MGFYALVGVLSLVLFPLAYKRSGSMTRYVPLTGAPIVWLLLLVASGTAAISEAAGDPGTSQAVFSGGLIGTAFAQLVLLRRVGHASVDARAEEERE
ncbi:MAG TPA: hypothetical protein VHO27_11790 [Angustibacter sp.]|nr:hypothetical protein [Angustibacter sp.]